MSVLLKTCFFVGWLTLPILSVDGQIVVPEKLVTLQTVTVSDSAIRESSGLSVSRRDPARLWTHNDSGDAANLFAIDVRSGEISGQWTLAGINPMDWEAMAGWTHGGENRLLVADVGDNRQSRTEVRLHCFLEPDPNGRGVIPARQVQTIRVRYPDGPVDCEAVWVQPDRELVWMLVKKVGFSATLYSVPLKLPTSNAAESASGAKSARSNSPDPSGVDAVLVARPAATLPTPMATGGDRDPRTGDVWVTSYFNAWYFAGGKFNQSPRVFQLPRTKQIEAIAIDPKRDRLWFSSEGTPCVLQRVSRAVSD